MKATAMMALFAMGGTMIAAQRGGDPADDLAIFDVSGTPVLVGRSLPAPANATIVPGGRSSNVNTFESNVRLDTSLEVPAVASHYSTRIGAAGWHLEIGAADGRMMSVARFSGSTSAGAAVTALLTVTRLTPTRIDVALRLARHEAVPSRGGPPIRSGRPSPPPGRPGGAGASAFGGVPPPAAPGSRANAPARGPAPTRPPPTAEEILRLEPVTAEPGESYVTRSTLPPGFPAELLPAKAVVRIVAVSKTIVTVVATSPTFPMAAITQHVQALLRAGWIDVGITIGGFTSDQFLFPEVCRGDDNARLRFINRSDGGVDLRVRLAKAEPCHPIVNRPFGDVGLPLLILPPGVVPSLAVSGGNNESHYSSIRITSAGDVADLATHFVGLMTQSGWPMVGRVEPPGMSVSRHAAKSSSGEPVTSILAVVKIPGTTAVDAWLRIVRHGPSRR